MSSFSDENPHVRGPTYCQTVFWKERYAACEKDADRAVVHVGPTSACYGSIEFRWPQQKFEVENLERMLQKAYSYGIEAGKKEIRDVLGITQRR